MNEGAGKPVHREEQDSMGVVRVPVDAHYGSQTQRAVDNFMDSGLKPPLAFVHALALIKRCAAEVNHNLGLLPAESADAIVRAAEEVMQGRWDDQFVVDLFQTGSGTSTNMNMNEVLASRANELLTGRKGGRKPVHPNDHVNLGQSSNDAIPSALHIAAARKLTSDLLPALTCLRQSLESRAAAFSDVRKIGRTHLQDAVPMTLGQSFSGFARQIELATARIEAVMPRLRELALGGTAVGNGLNAPERFAAETIARIAELSGIGFKEAVNHFEAQAARDAAVEAGAALKTVAVSLIKIANDIRWLGSGPRCGIGELKLPALQPGSSIMPGKVNPVIPEAVIQVAAQVIGNDTTITLAGQGGNFELNAMLPVLAYNLLQSIHILSAASSAFAEKCVKGIAADAGKCASYIEKSLALATFLVPRLGYDKAARISRKAHETGKTIRQIMLDENLMTETEFETIINV